MKVNKIIYFSVAFTVVLAAALLNFSIKSPNDGALYYSAADFFLENKFLADPTRTFEDSVRAFPTTQIAIVFYLIFLKSISQNYWIIIYCVIFALIWSNLFCKLIYFSKKNFSQNNNLYIFLPLIIFFNYDYIVSASSFYNELFYYPFLIFSFLKIHNSLQKNKNIFDKSFLFSTFLLLGVTFRLQHMVFLGTLALYFLYFKEFKNFFKISFFILFSILIIFVIQKFLSAADSTNIINFVDGKPVLADMNTHWLDKFILILENQILQLNPDLLFKNLKVQLALFNNFLNLPKIIDYNLPNNFRNFPEFIYGSISFLVILLTFLSLRKSTFQKFKIILLIYIFLTSIFLFLLTDHSSRYFLLVNFCILFFLFDSIYKYKFKINFKWFSFLSAVYLLVIIYYGYNFFKNKGAQSKNTYNLNSILRDFDKHKSKTYSNNSIFITRYRYNVYWVTKKPAYLVWEFFDVNFKISQNKDIKFYYVGDKRDLKNYQHKIKKIEDFSYSKYKSKNFSIWRLYF